MSDISFKVNQGVKLTASGEGSADFAAMANGADISRVWIWDIGPEKPVLPKRPQPPRGKEGDPEYDLAAIEFKSALEDYAAALAKHKLDQVEYDRWIRVNGGPMLMQQWSCDARDTFDFDGLAVTEGRQTRRRYFLSSRTRGHGNLPNMGLPEGLSPGRGYADLVKRERAGEENFDYIKRSDPVFGSEARAQ